jgi:hypothetical protein
MDMKTNEFECVGCIQLVYWQAVTKVVINLVSIGALNFLTCPYHRLGKQQVYCLIHYTREVNETFSVIDLVAPELSPLKQVASRFTIRFYCGCDSPFTVEAK